MKRFAWFLFLGGCSSVDEISTSNHNIQQYASEILHTDNVDVIHKHANSILKESNDIASVIGNVKDSTPWWADMITYGFVALAIIGVCFLLWYTGIGSLLQRLFYSMGLFIPDRKQQQAKMLIEAQDDQNPTTIREAVATLRASDPALNAAYTQLKKEGK
jgi:hypothetical protein